MAKVSKKSNNKLTEKDFLKHTKPFFNNTNLAINLPKLFTQAMGITPDTKLGILPIPRKKAILLVNISNKSADEDYLQRSFVAYLFDNLYKNDLKKREEVINKIKSYLEEPQVFSKYYNINELLNKLFWGVKNLSHEDRKELLESEEVVDLLFTATGGWANHLKTVETLLKLGCDPNKPSEDYRGEKKFLIEEAIEYLNVLLNGLVGSHPINHFLQLIRM